MIGFRGAMLPVLVLASVSCQPPDAATIRTLQAGDAAPDYAATTLAGETVSLEALRGEAVMLNVWATWCVPCRAEMPLLEELHREHVSDGLRILGVSIDAAGMKGDIEQFIGEHDITFTILHDPGEQVSRTFRTRAVPETFLINRNGEIVRRWIGHFDPMAPDARDAVRRALETD